MPGLAVAFFYVELIFIGIVRLIRSSPFSNSLMAMFFAAMLLLTATAHPAKSDPDSSPAPIEEVLVLGSQIPRPSYQNQNPVIVIPRAEIQRLGATTLSEFLTRHPQFGFAEGSGTNRIALLSSDRIGRGTVNLRGLGAKRNLVLVNGKRLGPSGADGIVDINQIPAAMVERVEVLTGGASSSYGSDAMSGVVNVILRSDVRELEFASGFKRSDRGDGEEWSVSLSGGTEFAGGRGSVSGFLDYTDRSAIPMRSRAFSSLNIEDNWTTGRLEPMGTGAIPGNRTLGQTWLDGQFHFNGLKFDADGNPQLYNDPDDSFAEMNQYLDLSPSMERVTAGGRLDYRFGDRLGLHLDLLASNTQTQPGRSPASVYRPFLINLDSPLLTPATRRAFTDTYDPDGRGFAVIPMGYRAVEVGTRDFPFTRDAVRLSGGLHGSWKDSSAWRISYGYSDRSMEKLMKNGVSIPRLQQALLVNPETGDCFDTEGGCAPAQIFGAGRLSSLAADFIRAEDLRNMETTKQQVAQFNANSIWSWRGLDMPFAFGLEWRQDSVDYQPDPLLTAQAVTSFQGTRPVKGRIDVAEAYIEILVPIARDMPWIKRLELEAGLRFSNYSHAGDNWTYKGGLDWRVSDAWSLQGMYQRAVRAPNLIEYYDEYRELRNASNDPSAPYDPCSASESPGSLPGAVSTCIAQGIPADILASYEADRTYLRGYASSGNTDLQVETADTFTASMAWQPEQLPGMKASIGFYRININDVISFLDSGSVLNFCFYGQNTESLCEDVKRAPSGDIDLLLGGYKNLGELNTSGYDLNFSYNMSVAGLGSADAQLSFRVQANQTLKSEVDLYWRPPFRCEGKFGYPCIGFDTPDQRLLANVVYDTGPLTAALSWRWIGSVESNFPLYIELQTGSRDITSEVSEISSTSYWDATLEFRLGKRGQVILGVINLSDQQPPLMGDLQVNANTNGSTYDVVGRRYHAAFRWRF